MQRYILNRIGQSLIVLFLFLTAIFFFSQLIMPGDFAIILGFGEGVVKVNEIRAELGLDQPILERYVLWMRDLMTGDLGNSFYRTQDFRVQGGGMIRMPVGAIIGRALLVSAFLFGLSTIFAFLIGIWLGKSTAWNRARKLTGAVTFFGIILCTAFPPLLAWSAIEVNRKIGLFREIITMDNWREHYLEGPLWRPSTFAALMLASLILVAVILVIINQLMGKRYNHRLNSLALISFIGLFWIGGWFSFGTYARFMDIVHFLGLGIVVIILLTFGETMIIMQSSMKDTQFEEYIFAARAKGLREKTILNKHAARNAILPVLSRLIISMPLLLSGMVMVEHAVDIGGMGTTIFESLRVQDVPVVMGGLVVIGLIALVTRLILEIVIFYLDPRLRFGSSENQAKGQFLDVQSGGLVVDFIDWINSLFGSRQEDDSRIWEFSDKNFPGGNKIHNQNSFTQKLSSSWKRFGEVCKVFSENRLAVFGMVLILVFILMAFVQPILLKTVWLKRIYDPLVGYDPMIFNHPAFPTRGHLLGTDAMGRDNLSMLMAASKNTLAVALSSALTAAVIGTLFGAISAYYQGRFVETVLRYTSDMLLILPAPIVMVIIGARFYESINAVQFGVIYGLIAGGSYVAIVMRSQAFSIITKPFIAASRVAGAGGGHIIFTHMIPHMLPLAAVQMMLTVVGAVITYGYIAFVGVTRAELSWGSMIYQAFVFSIDMLGKISWMQMLSPAVALSMFAAAFYFVSRGLHEVAEPRLRKR